MIFNNNSPAWNFDGLILLFDCRRQLLVYNFLNLFVEVLNFAAMDFHGDFFCDCNFNNLFNLTFHALDFLHNSSSWNFSSDCGWNCNIFVVVESNSIVHCIIFWSCDESFDWDLRKTICN